VEFVNLSFFSFFLLGAAAAERGRSA
jgi:hypothetical protein